MVSTHQTLILKGSPTEERHDFFEPAIGDVLESDGLTVVNKSSSVTICKIVLHAVQLRYPDFTSHILFQSYQPTWPLFSQTVFQQFITYGIAGFGVVSTENNA